MEGKGVSRVTGIRMSGRPSVRVPVPAAVTVMVSVTRTTVETVTLKR